MSRAPRPPAYFTMSETAWLQSPSPVFVTARYLNCTVDPGVSPGIVVFAWIVEAAVTQVLASVLYCHSHDERAPAEAATSFAEPEMAPGFALKTRGARTGVFLSPIPAPSMIDAPFSTLASAAAWTVPLSCWSSTTSAARFSLRTATAPLVRSAMRSTYESSLSLRPWNRPFLSSERVAEMRSRMCGFTSFL